MNTEVLNSWKEIAAYLGRGVRTVQRWEQELGLPVRRPRGKERSAVIALKPDLDLWLQNVPRGFETTNGDESARLTIRLRTDEMIKRTQEIVERSMRIQEMVRNTLALTSRLRDQQAQHRVTYTAKKVEHHSVLAKTVSLGLEIQKLGGGTKISN